MDKGGGAGERAVWLRALATLAEGLGSVPMTHTMAQNCRNPSSKESNVLFWPPKGNKHMCGAHMGKHTLIE